MEINLSRLQAGELQLISSNIKSNQKMIHALNNFDSSEMSFEAQLNHKLMKLTEMVKGNLYNADIEKLAAAAADEFMNVKDKFFIDDRFAPLLVFAIKKEIERYKGLIDYYKSPECEEFKYDKDNSRETFVTNYGKRLSALENSLNSIVAEINL